MATCIVLIGSFDSLLILLKSRRLVRIENENLIFIGFSQFSLESRFSFMVLEPSMVSSTSSTSSTSSSSTRTSTHLQQLFGLETPN